MATAYEIVREQEVKKPTLCCCESKKVAPELTYPEPQNILSTELPVPQHTCE